MAITDRVCFTTYQTQEGTIRCTFLKDHNGPCSWQAVADLDQPASKTAQEALDLASFIVRGDYDPYLELLLNAAHNRKRALRGAPGFFRSPGGDHRVGCSCVICWRRKGA